MKNLNMKVFISVLLGVSVIVWLVVLMFSNVELKFSWEAIKKLPSVVTIDLLLWAIFVKYLWKLTIFQGWLVRVPILEGSWHGLLQFTWKESTQKEIPIVLVIRQTLLGIYCAMYSEEMNSRSSVSEFLIDKEAGIKKLVYSYTSSPNVNVRERSPVHRGTASLDYITNPERKLVGEYWTNRKTTGQLELSFYSSKLLESFPEELKNRK